MTKIVVGRFGSPYGVKGWVKVISFTDPPAKILGYEPWVIVKSGISQSVSPVQGRMQGGNVVVQLDGCNDRDEAKTYTNIDILIEREQLPDLPNDEFYWVDLVGLTVFNTTNEMLGKVDHLFATGSNDVLVTKDESGKTHNIPYLDHVIMEVDLKGGRIIVDWDLTWVS